MYYLVWPEDGLRRLEGNPRRDPALHALMIATHRLELEQLRDGIVAAVSQHLVNRDQVRKSIGVYPGIGRLLIDDAFIQVGWLREYLSRRLSVRYVKQLPQPRKQPPIPSPVMAQPWHLGLINRSSPAAAPFNGAGIKVGVIDSGYDPAYPDFRAPFAAIFAEYRYATSATAPEMKEGVAAHDFDAGRHGTGVCAVLAGQSSGVAKGITLYVAAIPVSPITPLINNPAMMEVALNWLNVKGCDIITTSVFTGTEGEVPPGLPPPLFGASLDTIEELLAETRSLKDTFVVAAIGNTKASGKFRHPASSVHATGIGSVSSGNTLGGSAWGAPVAGVLKPDFVAPGDGLQIPNTTAGQHDAYTGTSFAAPIFAAAAALVLQKHNGLRGNPNGLKGKLDTLTKPVASTSSVPLPANSTGKGLIDLTNM